MRWIVGAIAPVAAIVAVVLLDYIDVITVASAGPLIAATFLSGVAIGLFWRTWWGVAYLCALGTGWAAIVFFSNPNVVSLASVPLWIIWSLVVAAPAIVGTAVTLWMVRRHVE